MLVYARLQGKGCPLTTPSDIYNFRIMLLLAPATYFPASLLTDNDPDYSLINSPDRPVSSWNSAWPSLPLAHL